MEIIADVCVCMLDAITKHKKLRLWNRIVVGGHEKSI